MENMPPLLPHSEVSGIVMAIVSQPLLSPFRTNLHCISLIQDPLTNLVPTTKGNGQTGRRKKKGVVDRRNGESLEDLEGSSPARRGRKAA